MLVAGLPLSCWTAMQPQHHKSGRRSVPAVVLRHFQLCSATPCIILALLIDRLHHHLLIASSSVAATVMLHAAIPCSASHYPGSLNRLPSPSPPLPPPSCCVLRGLAQLHTILALLANCLYPIPPRCLAQLRTVLADLVNHLHHRLLTHRYRHCAACVDAMLIFTLFALF
ncbi:hypothetical protein NDU88_008809 [Pleurodeles waltl]|uniref:Uncharacterized protein n=1 Tax=Pleurodeles waltl TaxID=8319 RepID=A0AAV7RUU5_PLEWA|nr:hypothetical protein NDU88_008809 [Pleurodeles waltl]